MPLPVSGRNITLYGPNALATAIANNGTLTIPAYPAGTTQATFQAAGGGPDQIAIINNNDIYKQSASQILVTFGASTITLQNLTGATWPAGAILELQMDAADLNYFQGQKSAAVPLFTTSVGTPSDTIPDVGASFNQSTLNNIVNSLAAKINALNTALKNAQITS